MAKGLSLVEVVLVLALAMVLAAAILPKLLRSRVAVNEAWAIHNLGLITTAQRTYKTAYPQLGYADRLDYLAFVCSHNTIPTPDHACLIDCTFASVLPKDGYYYGLQSGPEASTLPRKTYVVSTAAVIPHKDGDHNFCATEDQIIRYESARASKSHRPMTWLECQALPIFP